MDQQTFLRLAQRELGLSDRQLALDSGVSPRSAVKRIARLLEDRRRTLILSGDRAAAEVIDALLAHVDAAKFQESLRTFNALQQAANTFGLMAVARDKPRYFKSFEQKNKWANKEELENAGRMRKGQL